MGNSRLDASVSIKFSQKFACQVSWQNIDETGAAVEEDITDGGSESGGGGGGGTNPPGELEE
jgi:hypothetical protein